MSWNFTEVIMNANNVIPKIWLLYIEKLTYISVECDKAQTSVLEQSDWSMGRLCSLPYYNWLTKTLTTHILLNVSCYFSTSAVTSQRELLLLKVSCHFSKWAVTSHSELLFLNVSCYFSKWAVISQSELLLLKVSCYFSTWAVTSQSELLFLNVSCYFPKWAVISQRELLLPKVSC